MRIPLDVKKFNGVLFRFYSSFIGGVHCVEVFRKNPACRDRSAYLYISTEKDLATAHRVAENSSYAFTVVSQ